MARNRRSIAALAATSLLALASGLALAPAPADAAVGPNYTGLVNANARLHLTCGSGYYAHTRLIVRGSHGKVLRTAGPAGNMTVEFVTGEGTFACRVHRTQVDPHRR